MIKQFRNINESVGLKIRLTFLIMIIVSISLVAGASYTQSYNLLVDSLGKRSIKIAEIGAQKIDIETFKTLRTIEDEQTMAYQRIRESLSELRELTGTKYIYTMRKNDKGEFIYVVDGSASEELSHIGDIEESNIFFETTWKGNEYISDKIEVGEWGMLVSSHFPLKDKEGKVVGFIGVDYDVEVEYKAFQRFKFMLLGISLGLLIVALFFGMLLSKKITMPIIALMKLVQKIEKGDLTVHTQVTVRDEIGNLSNSFNRMVEYIAHLIKRVGENSAHMSKSGQELSIAVEAINMQTNAVNISVNEIAIGMEQTTAVVEEVTASSSEIMVDLKALLDKASNSNEIVKEIKQRAIQMKKSLQESNDMTQQIYKEKQNHMTQAIEQGKVVSEIRSMVSVIAKISDQTNLLAVNAGIEAARSREQGRGFSVIAEEVRKLAKQSSQTVKGIEELVKQVQQAFSNLSDTSQGMLEFIDNKVINDYNRLMDTGAHYLKDAECMEELINDFVSRSKGVSETVHEVNIAIESVAATVEQTTVSLQEISESTSQTVKAVQEVMKVAKMQTSEAKELNAVIETLFETN